MVLSGSPSEGPFLRASPCLDVQLCSLPSPLGDSLRPALENRAICIIYFFILREPVSFFKLL